jgi:hypothetical protein
MTISATTRMTAAQIKLLDNMNVASQKAGGLGTRLDAMQFDGSGTAVSPSTLVARKYLEYTCAPVLGATTTIHAAIALTASAQTSYALTNQPDVPRVLNVTGNAGGISGNVKIYGTDFAGTAINDTIALSGSSTVAGARAFATVTMVDLPAQTHSGTDTVAIGVSTTIVGMPSVVPYAAYLLSALFNGSTDAGSLAIDAALSKNLYTAAGTFNGVLLLKLIYVA